MPLKTYIEHLESEGHKFIINSSLHPPRKTGKSWFILKTHFKEELFNSRNIEQSGSSYPSTFIGPVSRALVPSNAACSQVQLAPANGGLAPFNASLSNTYALSEPRLASASARYLRLLASRNNNWTGVTAPATQEWGVTAPATPQGWGQNSSVVPQSQESLNDNKN